MPAFREHLDERDAYYALMRPAKRRIMLKLYCIKTWMGSRRFMLDPDLAVAWSDVPPSLSFVFLPPPFLPR